MKEKTKPERSQDYVQHAETQYISVITPWDQSCTQIDNGLCSSELIELNLIFTIKHHQLDFLCLVKKNPISRNQLLFSFLSSSLELLCSVIP